jgi:hypothetical protein
MMPKSFKVPGRIVGSFPLRPLQQPGQGFFRPHPSEGAGAEVVNEPQSFQAVEPAVKAGHKRLPAPVVSLQPSPDDGKIKTVQVSGKVFGQIPGLFQDDGPGRRPLLRGEGQPGAEKLKALRRIKAYGVIISGQQAGDGAPGSEGDAMRGTGRGGPIRRWSGRGTARSRRRGG